MNFMSKKGGYQARCDENKKMNKPIQVIFGLCNMPKRQNLLMKSEMREPIMIEELRNIQDYRPNINEMPASDGTNTGL